MVTDVCWETRRVSIVRAERGLVDGDFMQIGAGAVS